MEKVLILVSGMAGTGKTTFAQYAAESLHLPLVSYDSLKSREWDCLHDNLVQHQAESLYGKAAYGFFWQFCEILMQAGTAFVAEYFFHDTAHPPMLEKLVQTYGYQVICVHMDADMEVAYGRFVQRNQNDSRHVGLRDLVTFETFCKSTQPNKDFVFGHHRLVVETNVFEQVCYEDILTDLQNLL